MHKRDCGVTGEFGGVKENEFVDESGGECSRVKVGSSFEKDTQEFAASKFLEDGCEIDLASA